MNTRTKAKPAASKRSYPLITREQAAHVKGAVDIVEVAQRYLALRRLGKHWVGRCPLHEGQSVSNKSLTVSQEFQNWRCWSCGARGDVISLVMAAEGVPYPLAVRFLAEQAGVSSVLPPAP